MRFWLFVIAVFCILLSPDFSRSECFAAEVDFSREIQPILARKCYACHGPDEADRQAGLRFDDREIAVEYGAIVPGKPEESSLIERIYAEDTDLRMPPPSAHDQLTSEEKKLLEQWIAAAAEYEPHWAFVPPVQPDLPQVANSSWPRNKIDYFVLARLEAQQLTPAVEADRYTLIRRLYLDLIGLPPTPEEAEEFVQDTSPDAYEKVVERLLQSPRYGEKWARHWLDLARYADTNGYEKDRPRSIWPYRDWVIRAINDDMPFDQFSIEQLAGDMLPDPTTKQLIATGFHRNTMLNEEGGIDPLEYRYLAMVDRVATTGTVWMGMTTGCCQCHSHKYDPLSHTDYFRLMALLNNADEPEMIVQNAAIQKQRENIEQQIAELEAALVNQFPVPEESDLTSAEAADHAFWNWLPVAQQSATDWKITRPVDWKTNLPRLEVLEDGSIFSTGDITKRDLFELEFSLDKFSKPVTGLRLEVLPDDRLPAQGPGRAYYEGRKGDFFLSELTAAQEDSNRPFAAATASYGKISIGSGSAEAANVIDGEGSTGWSTSEQQGQANQLVLTFAEPVDPTQPLNISLLFERHFAASLGRFRISLTTSDQDLVAKKYSADVEQLLLKEASNLSPDELAILRQEFFRQSSELDKAREQIDKLRQQLPDYPTTLVMQERPEDNPRPTYRHHRGEYLNAEEKVTPGVPLSFPQLAEDQPANRLTFARWLVSEKNPLIGRVVVNRHWQELFGAGIVRSPGDFGTQSEPPTHPQLLDWLAVEFPRRNWSRKELHRMIVTSATYRQTTAVEREKYTRDPDNRLLARGPRHRLHAETIRDTLLAATEMLSEKMYGPGVYPPQPGSVTALAYGNSGWTPSRGEDRYRRSIYTFTKRTAPFAAFTTFDGPTGETCTVQRDRSNTPLQALTLLNDEMYLELAQELAMKIDLDQPPTEIVQTLFRRFLTRPPSKDESRFLLDYYESQLARIEQGELNPASLMNTANANGSQAAWMTTIRILMNLDEAIVSP